ncbi:HD domain-containing phosphohydrolase [Poseidonibacter sp.]|uniref:HD domain-containing phosphohydrolase n=1 Tax=Poseidonibacter sp. TaxID=2321188 RepID=UPI003C789840
MFFLTHSHADHITDLPFIVEGFFEKRTEPLTIYASKETIDSLKMHTFNNQIWPDFSKINLLNSDKKSLVFKEIKIDETITINKYEIKAINAIHIPGAFGFVIIKDDIDGYLISGDTYLNEELVEEINNNPKIKLLITECSFPNKMAKLAYDSQHLTPSLLAQNLQNLKRTDIQIFIYHLKHIYEEQMQEEIKELDILKYGGKILEEGDVIHINSGEIETDMLSHVKFQRIMDINLELANELDKDKLFEMILTLTRELTHSEAGTLYIKSEDKNFLDFKVVQNKPLDIYMGGTKSEITWDSLPLYLEDGSLNKSMIAAVSALDKKIININNVYENDDYDFSGTKNFDKNTGYKTKSVLVIPLTNHEDDVIGVLQLINKTKVSGRVTPFNKADEEILKALAAQAAMALTNSQLITSLEAFLNAFVSTIASAIDAKSKHTLCHINKVSKLAPLIAQAIHDDDTLYKDVKYTKDQMQEIELAAKMHDIGKISMPESIIDKATKLQLMLDGIDIIKERAEIMKRDFEILLLKNEISQDEYETRNKNLQEDILFLEKVNIGGEFMRDEDIEKIEEISLYTYLKDGKEVQLLTNEEKYNLSIRKGTLTAEEKLIMNSHAKLSYDMLTALPFPKKYSNVVHIAVNHHEKLNGKGYPRGLSEKDLVLEDRIMILADIFEALTASDRPYKGAKKLSEVFKILSFMAKDNEIDADLLKFFQNSKTLEEYAKEQLLPMQIDEFKSI